MAMTLDQAGEPSEIADRLKRFSLTRREVALSLRARNRPVPPCLLSCQLLWSSLTRDSGRGLA